MKEKGYKCKVMEPIMILKEFTLAMEKEEKKEGCIDKQKLNMWMNWKMKTINYFNRILEERTEEYINFQNGDL